MTCQVGDAAPAPCWVGTECLQSPRHGAAPPTHLGGVGAHASKLFQVSLELLPASQRASADPAPLCPSRTFGAHGAVT